MTPAPSTRAAFTAYEITSGGLLRHLERTLHITRGDERDWLRRCAAALTITYLPIMALGLGWRLFTGEWLPGLARVDTHVRPLITIPLLLAAEPFVETRVRAAGRYLLDAGLVGRAVGPYPAAIARTVRLRDSQAIEAALLIGALGLTLTGETYAGQTSELAWGAMPGIAVFRFLLLRWLWRWLLWGVFLVRLIRLPLALRATHPDRVAGLAPLVGPGLAFAAVIAAGACELSSLAANLMLREQVSLAAFYPLALAYAATAVSLPLAPVCAFVPALYRIRNQGLCGYGAFARRFAEAFEERWFGAPGAEGLGAQDISSLCDLGGSYEVVTEIRVFTWGRRLAFVALIAAAAPALPLVVWATGLHESLQQLGSMLLAR